MSAPLPWVKAWTKVFMSPKWLDTPMEYRGVFDHLIRLGAVGTRRGFVEGTDEQIARQMNVSRDVVFSALETFTKAPWNSLRRRKNGVAIVNWSQYQTPQNFDPDYAAQRRQNVDTPIDASIAREEGEGDQTERHVLLVGYVNWIDSPTDTKELNRLILKYPTLDLAEELRDFMAYADRRAADGNAYIDYIAAFRNRLQSQLEYHKKRGWAGVPQSRPRVVPSMDDQLARLKAR